MEYFFGGVIYNIYSPPPGGVVCTAKQQMSNIVMAVGYVWKIFTV